MSLTHVERLGPTYPGSVRGVRGLGWLVAVVVAGCAAGPPAPAVYPSPPRPARPSETVTTPVPTTDGDTVFEIIALTTGMRTVLGSHAELPAKGQYVRLRVAVSNSGRNSVLLDTSRQLLRTADGATYPPDPQAMLVKRQPAKPEVGPGNRFEFDLYYDVPAGAVPVGMHAFGGPTLADFADATGTDVPL